MAKAYNCEMCDSSFKSLFGMKKHKKSQHDENSSQNGEKIKVQCQHCALILFNKASLKRHIFLRHEESQIEKDKKRIKCDLCWKVLCNDYSLRRHIKLRHIDGETSNPLMNNGESSEMDNENALDLEQKSSSNKPVDKTKVKCDLCCRVLSNNQSLKRHIRLKHIATEKRPEFFLDALPQSLSSNKTSMTGTEAIVKDEEISPKSVDFELIPEADEGELKPRHSCKLCPKTFSDRKEKKRHFKREHMNANRASGQTDIDTKVYNKSRNCKFCTDFFPDFKTLIKHIRQVHDTNSMKEKMEEVSVKCSVCDLVLSSKESWKVHVLSVHCNNSVTMPVHNNKSVFARSDGSQCPECDFTTSNPLQLGHHMGRFH